MSKGSKKGKVSKKSFRKSRSHASGKKKKRSVEKQQTKKVRIKKKNVLYRKKYGAHSKKHARKRRKVLRKKTVKGKTGDDIRIVTGIPNFDKLINGGFEKNSTNLLVGGSGSGKSIFATQFLIEGMKKGEKCLYATFEEEKVLFTFLQYTPIKVKTMLEEGGGSIESIILRKKITRMVIDSITSFALLFEDELSKREAALELFGMIRDWSCTALLTLEEEPTVGSSKRPKTLEFEVDSMIALYFLREKGERKRFLEVLKMRGTGHSRRIFPFNIGKNGILISRSPIKSLLKR